MRVSDVIFQEVVLLAVVRLSSLSGVVNLDSNCDSAEWSQSEEREGFGIRCGVTVVKEPVGLSVSMGSDNLFLSIMMLLVVVRDGKVNLRSPRLKLIKMSQ